ncbi:ATP-binding protein [Roseateles sp. GG27B]
MSAPLQALGAHASRAELAVSAWSGAELDDWWSSLRALEGSHADLPARLQPPEAVSAWNQVALPDVRSRNMGHKHLTHERYEMRWYRLRFESANGYWPAQMAIYLPRLVGLAATVLVRSPEGWRPVFDNQAAAREQWVRPLWVELPDSLIEASQGQLIDVVIAVPVLQGGFYSVPSIWLDAAVDVEAKKNLRWALQIGVPQGTGFVLAMLALFSVSLWARRRKESAYLVFALLAVAWWVRNLHYYLDLPHGRLALDWFWWMSNAAMSWVMLLTLMFALRVVPRRFVLIERSMLGFVLISSVAAMPFWMPLLDTSVLVHSINAAVGAAAAVFVMVLAWRDGSRSRELRVIALSVVLTLVLGLHDLVLLSGWAWPEHIYLMPFACLASAGSFLYVVKGRYVEAHEQVDQLNVELIQRLQAQGLELQQHYEHTRKVERQHALMVERQRLMQDMHDGLGSSLLSAMVAVEQGSMEQNQVVEVLRECVDDLRLVIDSLEPVGYDLVALLATMRYRLGKRLQVGGLTLEWDVQDLPPLPWLEPPDALHVLRLMQEALSNVLKHARATRVRMVTRHHGSYVEIRVEDDGDGFDFDNAQRGRGLKSQQRRAQRLGGSLSIDSSLGNGTRLSLRLPVLRHSAPNQQSTG